EPVLKLVAGAGKRARQGLLGVAHHPAEDLGRGGNSAELGRSARCAAQVSRCAGGEGAADGGCKEQRAEHVRAAALVLAGSRLAVLVPADRDVLRAAVGGERGAAE